MADYILNRTLGELLTDGSQVTQLVDSVGNSMDLSLNSEGVLDVNIESIQKALFNMEELQKETNRMIAVLEVKRDAKR
jgi:hypothetical protein